MHKGKLLAHIGMQRRLVVAGGIHRSQHEIDPFADAAVEIGDRRTADIAEPARYRAILERLQRTTRNQHGIDIETDKGRHRRTCRTSAIAAMAVAYMRRIGRRLEAHGTTATAAGMGLGHVLSPPNRVGMSSGRKP